MSNPMPNEHELYEKIQSEKITIPSPIWELMEHHLGNDAYAISLIAATYVTGSGKEPIPVEAGEKILKHVDGIRNFLNKLREINRLKQRKTND